MRIDRYLQLAFCRGNAFGDNHSPSSPLSSCLSVSTFTNLTFVSSSASDAKIGPTSCKNSVKIVFNEIAGRFAKRKRVTISPYRGHTIRRRNQQPQVKLLIVE